MQKASSFIRPAMLIPRTHYAAGQVVPVEDSPEPLQETVSKTGLQISITNTEPLYPGNPLELLITVKIASPGSWTVNLTGSCQLQSYTGKIEGNLGYVKETIQLQGQCGRRGKLALFWGLLAVEFSSELAPCSSAVAQSVAAQGAAVACLLPPSLGTAAGGPSCGLGAQHSRASSTKPCPCWGFSEQEL